MTIADAVPSAHSTGRVARWSATGLLLMGLAGCSSLGPRPQVVLEQAIDGTHTPLGQAAARATAGFAPQQSGFRLMPDAGTSFNARIALARRAQKSIDAQYYLIGNDQVGRLFLRELRDAANRGVRVRLLVDDLYNNGKDALLAGLAAYPNVEVRLFNPLPVRSESFNWRVVASSWEFSRIDHRMHNKLFVVDNAFSVSGGRNLADEYFEQDAQADFVDVDVLSAGPVVQSQSAAFDRFWNSERAYPSGLVFPVQSSEVARIAFDDLVAGLGRGLPERERDVLNRAPVGQELDEDSMRLVPAQARVLVDDPMKAATGRSVPFGETVSGQVIALLASAKSSVRIVSPYFIPGEPTMKLIEGLGERHVGDHMVVVTNSLGATDEPLVYAEYAQYRLRMLRVGVRIFEVGARPDDVSGPDASHVGTREGAVTRLHAKVASIDDRLVYLGSMNFDGRSARRNTEIGLVIESPTLATTLSELSHKSLVQVAYQLRLAADGTAIEWVNADAQGRQVVHTTEPGSDWWTRLKLTVLLPWIDKDEL